jgi:hypothetical protein
VEISLLRELKLASLAFVLFVRENICNVMLKDFFFGN